MRLLILNTFTACANYGLLAHEKEIVWGSSEIKDWNAIQGKCTFKVPDNPHITDCYLNKYGETIFEIDGRHHYMVGEIMSNSPSGSPCLRWCDGSSYHTILLEEIVQCD